MANSAELLNDISQLLPTVFVEQITLDSITNSQQNNKNLKVSVTLSLKDIVDKDGISQWFADQDLQKYIKAHCLLITSESAFNDFYSLPSNYGYNELKFVFTDNQFITENILTIPSQKDLKQKKGVFTSENYITDNDDGTKEITVPIKTNYTLSFDEQNDSFLAVLCFLTFNLKEFAAAFKIDGIDEENALSRSFTSQVIFRDKNLVSESEYFILPNGDFYYGQFHVIDNNGVIQYKTGTVETEDSQVLQLVTESNNIISDFRTRKYFADKTTFDETGNVNKFFKDDLQIKKIIDKTKSNKKPFAKYFSDLFVSLDEKGSCRFSFFFDKQKFALENSFYPVVLDPEKNPKAIPELVRVKNISVYRIRKDIKEINFNSENNSVLIAKNSGTKEGLDVLNKPNTKGSYIIENSVDGVEPSIIKNYSVLDSEVSNINYGLYKYKIALEIVDPTKSYLYDSLNKAKVVLQSFKEYYNLSLSNKKIVTTIPNTIQQDADYVPYFDNLLGKFIPSFTTDNIDKLNVYQQQLINFLTLAKTLGYYNFNTIEEEQDFATSLNKLLVPPSASPDSIQVIVKLVDDFCRKIESLLEISDTQKGSNLSAKYKNNLLTFEYTFENSAANELGNSTAYDSSKIYDSYFNAAIINGAGFKVIDSLSNVNLGISSIELSDYKKLTDKLSQKYFNNFTSLNLKEIYGDKIQNEYNFVDEFQNDDSKYSFLTLSSIGTINKKYNLQKLSEQFSDQKFFENLLLDIVNYNTVKLSNFDKQTINKNSSVPKDEQTLKEQLLDLFSASPEFNGVSFSENISLFSVVKTPVLFNIFGNKNQGDFSDKIDNTTSNIEEDSNSFESEVDSDPVSLLLQILLSQIIKDEEKLKNIKDYSIFTPVNENEEKNSVFFMDKILGLAFIQSLFPESPSVQTTISNYFKNLPIPLKHLAASRGNITDIINAYSDSNSVKDATIYPENFFKYWINFKKIYEIQYFDGFSNNNIKFPNWKTLTINKLNSAQSNILCRIKKYTLDGFEEYFQDVAKFEMPLFDQHFYIIPDQAINLLTNIQLSIKKIPKITLPPLQLANPPPDKIGPISSRSVERAVSNVLRASTQIERIQTISSLVSTVRPIELQQDITTPSKRIEPIKVEVDITNSRPLNAPRVVLAENTVVTSAPFESPRIVVTESPSIAQQNVLRVQPAIVSLQQITSVERTPAVIVSAPSVAEQAPRSVEQQKIIVVVDTPRTLESNSIERQSTTISNESRETARSEKQSDRQMVSNMNEYIKQISSTSRG